MLICSDFCTCNGTSEAIVLNSGERLPPGNMSQPVVFLCMYVYSILYTYVCVCVCMYVCMYIYKVKVPLSTPRNTRTADAQLQSTLTSHGEEWSTWRSGRFTPEKEPRYPLHRRLDGPHSRCGCFGEQKFLSLLTGFESGIFKPVAQPLYRLQQFPFRCQFCPKSIARCRGYGAYREKS